MKTKLLATTAMVLIGLSGAAWAQQTTPAGKPDQADEPIRTITGVGCSTTGARRSTCSVSAATASGSESVARFLLPDTEKFVERVN